MSLLQSQEMEKCLGFTSFGKNVSLERERAHWFSKYPSEVSPTWNLLKLFSLQAWILIFVSIVSVSIFLFISAKIGNSSFGLKTFTGEIVLSPFRQIGPSNSNKYFFLMFL